jgi:type I restriction enzyme, S subunit
MKFELKTLDQLGFVGRGRSRHRPRGDEKLYGGKFPFIQTGDIQKADFYLKEYKLTYSDFGYEQSKLWKKGTLCISIVGANTAESAILGIDACFPDSVIGFIADTKKSDTIFVKYYLDTIRFQMKTISEGAARENLSMDKLLSMKLKVPSVEIQQKIASILSAYDELIENNKQRIKLLEEMAEEIYKEWFVRLRFPNYENTEFVDGLPLGWEMKGIFELSNVTYGFPFNSSEFSDEVIGLPVIRIRDIRNNYSKTFSAQEAPDKYFVENGDLLVGMDGDFHVGIWAGNRAYLNQRVVRFRPKNEVAKYFMFWSFKSKVDFLGKVITGTTVAHLSDKDLKKIQILTPPNTLMALYKDKTDSIFDLGVQLTLKNQLLQQTRDLLLPRLISGKLSVEGLLEHKMYKIGENEASLSMAAEDGNLYGITE